MSTTIEWTEETWNPIVAFDRETRERGWHCEKVSRGCTGCYAETQNVTQARGGTGHGYTRPSRDLVDIELHERTLLKPLSWRKPRRVFVCSMTDLFGEFVPDEWLDRIFAVMALTPHITYQVLTKRPERMREYMWTRSTAMVFDNREWRDAGGFVEDNSKFWHRGIVSNRRPHPDGEIGDVLFSHDMRLSVSHFIDSMEKLQWPLPNCWLGTSVEDQAAADTRIPELLATPAAVRFLSCEPLLGPLNLRWNRCPDCPHELSAHASDSRIVGCQAGVGFVCGCRRLRSEPGVDWVILGGESGAKARPCNVDWIRDGVRQCQAASVPVFVKQLGSKPTMGTHKVPSHRLYPSARAAMGYREEPTPLKLRSPHGRDMAEWPEDLRIREFPGGSEATP